MAISVNMLSERETSDCQARAKNGHPAHNTTGVANINCKRLELDMLSTRSSPIMWRPISSATTGADNAAAIQKRRVMSASPELGAVVSVPRIGSSAIPQIGQ